MSFFRSCGAERLMIGSDWPVCLVAGSDSRVMSAVEQYGAGNPPEMQEAVLGGTARRVWRLDSRSM
jgi:L-fuconolactonase